MVPDMKHAAAAIVAKIAPEKKTEKRSTPEGLVAAAEDIMDVLNSYVSSPPSDSDGKVEKATKEAARRAKAEILAQALCAFFDQYDRE